MSEPSHAPASPEPAALVDDCWNKIGVRGDLSCPLLAGHIHCRNCEVHSRAAARLLERPLPARHLADWSRHYARREDASAADTFSTVIFRIGAEWLALPTGLFQEIVEPRPVHGVPHRRGGALLGLTNVRGELMVCVAMDKILGIEKAAEPQKNLARQRRFLVLEREGKSVAFPAEEVFGVHRFDPGQLQPVPATVSKAAATYTRAIALWKEKTVGILDEALLFHTLSRSLS